MWIKLFEKEWCLLRILLYFVGNNQYCVGDTLKLECDDNAVLNIFSAESVPSLAGSQVCRNQNSESASGSENCEILSNLQVRILMNYIAFTMNINDVSYCYFLHHIVMKFDNESDKTFFTV